MKRFVFRLATVAKVRRIELDEQAKKLAAAFQEVARARNELNRLEKKFYDELYRQRHLLLSNAPLKNQMTDLSANYRDELKRLAVAKRKEIHQLMRRAEEERLKLVEKQKRKRVMEKLEEKERENYEQEVRTGETKIMDEISSYRFGTHAGNDGPSEPTSD